MKLVACVFLLLTFAILALPTINVFANDYDDLVNRNKALRSELKTLRLNGEIAYVESIEYVGFVEQNLSELGMKKSSVTRLLDRKWVETSTRSVKPREELMPDLGTVTVRNDSFLYVLEKKESGFVLVKSNCVNDANNYDTMPILDACTEVFNGISLERFLSYDGLRLEESGMNGENYFIKLRYDGTPSKLLLPGQICMIEFDSLSRIVRTETEFGPEDSQLQISRKVIFDENSGHTLVPSRIEFRSNRAGTPDSQLRLVSNIHWCSYSPDLKSFSPEFYGISSTAVGSLAKIAPSVGQRTYFSIWPAAAALCFTLFWVITYFEHARKRKEKHIVSEV